MSIGLKTKDESTFHTNEQVSSQNSRHMAFEDPNDLMNRIGQHYQKVNARLICVGLAPSFIQKDINEQVCLLNLFAETT